VSYTEPIKTTNKQDRTTTMDNLISKLSKSDQRHIKLALIHANNGNMAMLDAMIRSANSRSVGILQAIKGAL
jgi:hypothetical protein